jgi:hypothetical protein
MLVGTIMAGSAVAYTADSEITIFPRRHVLRPGQFGEKIL